METIPVLESEEEFEIDYSICGKLSIIEGSTIGTRTTNIETNTKYSIGRDKSCKIIIKNALISSIHCKIFQKMINGTSSIYIKDFSTNGTWVNSTRLKKNQQTILCHNDIINLSQPKGVVSFLFSDYNIIPPKRSKEGLFLHYDLRESLGSGAFATVYRAIEKSTGDQYAVKAINKRKYIRLDGRDKLMDEVNVLKRINHKNIVKVHDVFESKTHLYLVLELVLGGDLFQRILKKGFYKEQETKEIIKKVLEVLIYLHKRNIVHRDLKPENILLINSESDIEIKIADFGVSRIIESEAFMTTLAGTPNYAAPEVIKQMSGSQSKGYGKEVDFWSVGVLMYVLLSGSMPFTEERGDKSLLEQILQGDIIFPIRQFRFISNEAKNLILRFLTINPSERINIEEAINHPFITGEKISNPLLNIKKIPPNCGMIPIIIKNTNRISRRKRYNENINNKPRRSKRIASQKALKIINSMF